MKAEVFNWSLLARLAFDYDEYEELGSQVGSRGQEELTGNIVDIDYELDSTDLCYQIDWGYNRVEWASKEEFYRIQQEDTKELINPQTNQKYSECRYHEELGWFRYQISLNKIATYKYEKQNQADKLLWKSEQIDKIKIRIDKLTSELAQYVMCNREESAEYIQAEAKYDSLLDYLDNLLK